MNTSTSPKVQYAYSTTGNASQLTTLTYPNAKAIAYTYDGIGRVTLAKFDGNEVEALDYLGLGQVVIQNVGNTITQTLYKSGQTGEGGDHYTGLDRFGRIIELLWEDDTAGDDLEYFKYKYDRNNNILYRENEVAGDFDELYHASGKTTDTDRYDRLNQQLVYRRGELSDSNSDGVMDTVSTSTLQREYTFDGVGNHDDWTTVEGGTTVTTTRSLNLQNRLTKQSGSDIEYDKLGNLTKAADDLMVTDGDSDADTLAYDAWNRLITFNGTDRYAFDAMGRRVKQGGRTFRYDLNGNILEEHESGALKYQNAWSSGFRNRALSRFTYASGTLQTTETIYVIYDILTTVTTITDYTGVSLEHFVYDGQGNFVVWDGEWRGNSGVSAHDWAWNWGGGRWDAMTNLILIANFAVSPTLQFVFTLSEPPIAGPPPTPIPNELPEGCFDDYANYLNAIVAVENAIYHIKAAERALVDAEKAFREDRVRRDKEIHELYREKERLISQRDALVKSTRPPLTPEIKEKISDLDLAIKHKAEVILKKEIDRFAAEVQWKINREGLLDAIRKAQMEYERLRLALHDAWKKARITCGDIIPRLPEPGWGPKPPTPHFPPIGPPISPIPNPPGGFYPPNRR